MTNISQHQPSISQTRPPRKERVSLFMATALWAQAKSAAAELGLRSGAELVEVAMLRYLVSEGMAKQSIKL